jgi:hypothetical protein
VPYRDDDGARKAHETELVGHLQELEQRVASTRAEQMRLQGEIRRKRRELDSLTEQALPERQARFGVTWLLCQIPSVLLFAVVVVFTEARAHSFWLAVGPGQTAIVLSATALLAYVLERVSERRQNAPRPTFGRALLRYQLLPWLLVQPSLVVAAFFAACFSFTSAPCRPEEGFLVYLVGSGIYAACVALPLTFVALRAHRRQLAAHLAAQPSILTSSVANA